MPWAILGVAAVSGIASYAAQQSAADRQSFLQNQALQQWLQTQIPDPNELKIALTQFVNQGTLTPAFETAIKQDPSAFNQIVSDPKYKAAQDRALSQLEDVGNQGGLRIQDKAALQDALLQSNTSARANAEAIGANAAQRGQSGSGFALQAQLANQQGQADRDARSSLSVAGSAQDRALQAILQSGQLADQLQNSDFRQQAQVASANDAINQFNTRNAQNVNASNTQYQNQANLYNLSNKQNISNLNTGLTNQQEMYNKQIPQQIFDDQNKINAGATGQYNNLGTNALLQGQLLGNTISNVGAGASNSLASQQQHDFWDNYFKSQNANSAVDKSAASMPSSSNLNGGSAPTPTYSGNPYADPNDPANSRFKLGVNYGQ